MNPTLPLLLLNRGGHRRPRLPRRKKLMIDIMRGPASSPNIGGRVPLTLSALQSFDAKMDPIGHASEVVQGHNGFVVCCPYYYIGASSLGSDHMAASGMDVSGKSLTDLLALRRSIFAKTK